MKTFKYLLISLVLLLAATINAEELSYLNEKGELTNLTGTSTSVSSSLTSWSDGWYVVDGSVAISDRIQVSGTVNLLLKNGVTLIAEKGINVGSDASFNVYAQSDKESEMGALNATGYDKAAGIGGEENGSGGTITINGGIVSATVGLYGCGAGIGGGSYGAGGTITINGGIVSATVSDGERKGAGIGGGNHGAGGTITINGGIVSATGNEDASGIGGGSYGASGTITINGGIVSATVGLYGYGAGIGGGYYGTGGTITINGGIVSATGGLFGYGAGIGGGYNGAGGTITINGGIVSATGGRSGAGIGGGYYGAGGSVTINGGNVTAYAGKNSVGIGPGEYGLASGFVTLGWTNEDDFIYASSYGAVESMKFADGKSFFYEENGKGVVVENVENIGGKKLRPFYEKNNLKNVIVSGVKPYYLYTSDEIVLTYKVSDIEGNELVEGTDYTVSLDKYPIKGKGDYTLTIIAKDRAYTGSKKINFSVLDYIPVTTSTFTMDDGYGIPYRVDKDVVLVKRINVVGSVTLVLDEGKTLTASKGIEISSGNGLTIDGKGTLYATGENYAAGIGGGIQCSGGAITINGGTVIAMGGEYGAGIGGGVYGAGGTITINDGTVTAMGGSYGAGIGGGDHGAGGAITIIGGKVKAIVKIASVGIGPGASGPARGSVTLGWTNEDDFIYASSYGSVETIKFADGKPFYYEENGKTIIVEGSDNIGGKTLHAFDGNKNSLKYAFVSKVQPYYLYTGKEIVLSYRVMDVEGKELVEGTDYTASLNNSLVYNELSIKDKGDYKLTITAKDGGTYTGEKNISFTVGNGIPVTATTTAMTNGIYRVSSDVTIDERIVVTGDVTLILDEGKTLTASKGINVSSGNKLTIEGKGLLNAIGEYQAAGIGSRAYEAGGTIAINGGTVTATGTSGGAGIGGGGGGDGGTITINGGTVTATGTSGAGIGGGRGGDGGTITINGGKVTANAGEDASGFGSGYEGSGGFVTLGWTNEDDFVYASSYDGVGTIKFADGKKFYYEKNGVITAVKGTYDIGGKTLHPFYDGKNSLKYATVHGVKSCYLYTGEEIALLYRVTDIEGKELVEGTDYTVFLNNTSVNNKLSVKDKGDYTLTITAKKDGAYTGSKTISFTIVDGIPVTATTTELTSGIYRVSSDVTIDERIVISSNVTLFLDEGKTLTASKGIKLSSGNKLTIDGKGTLNATGEPTNSGIGDYEVGSLVIENGIVNVKGGDNAAGIGGSLNNRDGGDITINGGIVNATGGHMAAGIGGGHRSWSGPYGLCGTITINGGIVTAISDFGAGIGGGNRGSGGKISINGGIVTAISDMGAGIGSGLEALSDAITISIYDGVKKIAASSTDGECIGKGYMAEGSVIVNFISNGSIVTGDAKDAIFFDSGEGDERVIELKNLKRVVSLADDIKEHISVSPLYVVVGENVTLTLDGAVDVSSLKVNDGNSDLALTDVGNGKWTFVMPQRDVTVSARIMPTYSVTLPKQMILHSASNIADNFGKYQSGTIVSFRSRSFWTESNVSDGMNALTPTDGIYSVTVGNADIVIDGEFMRNSNVNLADIDDGFTAIDGDVMMGTTGYTVEISSGASVTLNDATFNGGISCLGSATVTLVGSNKAEGIDYYAGLWVGAWGTTVTIKGEGSLEAIGGAFAAGIGCSLEANLIEGLIVVNCGNVVIEGGNITAKGGVYAAGIGMSAVTTENYIYYMVGDISIKGGTVNAVAGSGASGIGVGNVPDEILNSGKKVTTVGKVSIYDDIEKVEASSISETVTYMHGETDVSANKNAYFNIVANGEKQSITPKNEPDYAITIDKNMKGGSVICRNSARAGDKVVLNPVPARGYTFNSLSVKDEQGNDISGNNGSSTGAYGVIISVAGDEETEKEYSFMMPARNVVVSAEFVIAYEIVFDEGIKNGSVTVDVVAPEPGDVVTLTAVPDEGYALAAFSVKDGQGNTVNVNDNTFVMPASKVIVSAVFSPAYNIAIDGYMENGSVTADKTVAIVGEKVSLMATPTNGYSLVFYTVKDAAGNDVAVSYDSFTMPEGGVTVSAVFAEGNIVYLDQLKRDYTVRNGDILTGKTDYRINAKDNDVTFMLYHATINGGITTSLNTTIILEDSNYVKGTGWNAGIGLGSSGKTLTIKGNGKLEAVGSEVHGSPGIGVGDLSFNGSERLNWGNLFIESGTITARGSGSSAGIGVGIMAANAISIGSIIINGGTVEAYGGKGSAGVGIGKDVRTASIKNIIFKGGTVTAKGGYGADADIGIGSDNELGTHSHLTISRIYFYHGFKEVSGNIKGISDVNIVYMNDGSDVTNNAEEYFAITSGNTEEASKVRSLLNIDIDNNIANGTIAATVASSNGKAYADEIVTLSATPKSGYKVDFYTVKDGAGNNVEVNGNMFVMPLGDVTVSAKFVPKYAAITFSEDGKKATIDGEYDGTDALQIDENITVENVVFNREFTPNSGFATIMLPFDINATKLTGVKSIIEFAGVFDNNGKNAVGMKYVWCNKDLGKEVENKGYTNCNELSGDLTAYTPYMVEMESATLGINGGVTLKPNSGASAGDARKDDWVFRGALQKKEWSGDENIIKNGRIWAFAGSERNGATIGQFRRIGGNTSVKPFRAYLVDCAGVPEGSDCEEYFENQSEPSYVSRYRFADVLAPANSAENSLSAEKQAGTATNQPLVMRVSAANEMASLNGMEIVIVDGDKDSIGGNEHTTVIGRVNPATGEIHMRPRTKQTYDLKGRKVGKGKKAKGAYYRK